MSCTQTYKPRDIERYIEALKLGFAFEDAMLRTICLAMAMLEHAVGRKQAAVISKDIKLRLCDGYNKPAISTWAPRRVHPLIFRKEEDWVLPVYAAMLTYFVVYVVVLDDAVDGFVAATMCALILIMMWDLS